jgi:hypothetical protein
LLVEESKRRFCKSPYQAVFRRQDICKMTTPNSLPTQLGTQRGSREDKNTAVFCIFSDSSQTSVSPFFLLSSPKSQVQLTPCRPTQLERSGDPTLLTESPSLTSFFASTDYHLQSKLGSRMTFSPGPSLMKNRPQLHGKLEKTYHLRMSRLLPQRPTRSG